MIIALIPTYGQRGYLDEMLQWLDLSGQVDAVEVLRQDEPLGSALARNQLIQQATAKYGYDNQFLMLDDDCKFNRFSQIRNAAAIIDREKDVGIVSFPLGGITQNGYVESIIVKHCWLINGQLLAAGANYTPGELYDSLDFCLQSYLLGFRNIITKEAFIWHDVAIDRSVRWRLVREGKQLGRSGIAERYADYIESIQEPYAIKLNDKAIELHNQRNLQLKNGTNSQ